MLDLFKMKKSFSNEEKPKFDPLFNEVPGLMLKEVNDLKVISSNNNETIYRIEIR